MPTIPPLELTVHPSPSPPPAAIPAAEMQDFKGQIMWEGRSYTVTARVPKSLQSEKIRQIFEDSLGVVKSDDIQPGTQAFKLQFGIPKAAGFEDGMIASIPGEISRQEFKTPEAIAYSQEIRATTKVPTSSPVVSNPISAPSAAAPIVPILPLPLSQPERIPLPHFANNNNNCFLTSTTWAFLLKDPLIRKELPSALALEQDPNKREALGILSRYLDACDESARSGNPVSKATVHSLRRALYLLSPGEFEENNVDPQDADAALTCFTSAIFEHSNLNNYIRYSTGAPEKNIGKLELTVPPINSLPEAVNIPNIIANYLVEDDRGRSQEWDTPPERLELTLKRYRRDGTKIETEINAPLVLPLIIGPADTDYRLVGAVCHQGETVKTGHYTAMVAEDDPDTGAPLYYLCNDLVVDPADSVVLSNEAKFRQFAKNAYKLLYVKI